MNLVPLCISLLKLKIENLLWKLIVNYSNFQSIFVLLKNVGYDFKILLVHFVTFLKASAIINFNFYRYGSSHIWSFGHLG